MTSSDADACTYSDRRASGYYAPTSIHRVPRGACLPLETSACSRGARPFSGGGFRAGNLARPSKPGPFARLFTPMLPTRTGTLAMAGPQPYPHPGPIGAVFGAGGRGTGGPLRADSMLPVSITPYYMSLVSRDDRSQPLRKTVIHRGSS